MPRVILIVLDGCGVGPLPDAAYYGATDPLSNTLAHVANACDLHLPTLQRLGLGNITPMRGVPPLADCAAGWGRCRERSAGKDSVTGHWEMMGVVTEHPFPTYPHGFPAPLIAAFEERIGRRVLGNKAASGTEIIAELGAEHVRTGRPIVYTSADSVFQVAAHEDVIPLAELYAICETARGLLVAPDNVQRVIARSFIGDAISGFVRTPHRKDFPLPPPEPNILTALRDAGKRVHGIGVVVELFPSEYFAIRQRTQSNAEHLAAIEAALVSDSSDFIFANCEDFDMLYGHRNDPAGFARALNDLDKQLGEILDKLVPDDLLLITADHGNDPTTSSTDHSREYVPLLAVGGGFAGKALGERGSMADIGATVARWLQVSWSGPGTAI
jgi:phosphopentomutase